MALHNSFKHALLNRERLVGAWFMSGSTVMAELVANAGYDFMVIDIEHSTASTHDLHALLQAVAESGTSPRSTSAPTSTEMMRSGASNPGAAKWTA